MFNRAYFTLPLIAVAFSIASTSGGRRSPGDVRRNLHGRQTANGDDRMHLV